MTQLYLRTIVRIQNNQVCQLGCSFANIVKTNLIRGFTSLEGAGGHFNRLGTNQVSDVLYTQPILEQGIRMNQHLKLMG